MHRKAIAFAIVLLFAGLAPATAIIGFCARMPCCSHAAADRAFSNDVADCCTSIACYEAPSAKLATGVALAGVTLAAPALVAVAPAPVAPPRTSEAIEPSPPATARERLAALSLLRI